jgi:hypothetical protein
VQAKNSCVATVTAALSALCCARSATKKKKKVTYCTVPLSVEVLCGLLAICKSMYTMYNTVHIGILSCCTITCGVLHYRTQPPSVGDIVSSALHDLPVSRGYIPLLRATLVRQPNACCASTPASLSAGIYCTEGSTVTAH